MQLSQFLHSAVHLALYAIEKMGDHWIPRMLYGKAMDVEYVMPVLFKLVK